MKCRHIALLLCAMAALTGCGKTEEQESPYVIDMASIGIPDPTQPTTEPPFRATSVHFAAVGDDLIHTCVYRTAEEQAEEQGLTDRDYDFHYCYAHVADRIAQADLAFINQETLICGDDYEITGSNLNFNSPTELGEDLIDIGFDVFNLTNNHMLDKHTDGLEACLDYWDTQKEAHENLVLMGNYRNAADMQRCRTKLVNGLTFGFLSYTDHTNGYTLPEDSELQIIYLEEEDVIQQQITELAEQVDCVIVSAHWGEEDTHEVRDCDREIAQKMIDWGADVIIGTGSHTLQTMEYLTRADGSQGFVFYSLGNFISGQTDNFNMIGGMGEFDICRDTEGVITVEHVTLMPLITHYESGMEAVRVYPYDAYTDELLESHYVPYAPSGTRKTWSREFLDTTIAENVPAAFLPVTLTAAQPAEAEADEYEYE